MTLFVRPCDPKNEIWDGPRCGLVNAVNVFSADEALPIETFPQFLDKLLAEAVTMGESSPISIYTDLPIDPRTQTNVLGENHIKLTSASSSSSSTSHAAMAPKRDGSITSFLRGLRFGGGGGVVTSGGRGSPRAGREADIAVKGRLDIRKLAPVLQELRLQKSEAEVALMRTCGRLTGQSFSTVMQNTRPGVTEHFLHALIDFEVRRRGAQSLAYVPVVAGGKNALTLHYVMNTQVLMDGDLILMDAGAEYGHYASDITRTWPINGRFSPAQAEIYEAVLRTNKECISKCTESSMMSLDDIQNLSVKMLRSECERIFKRRVTAQLFLTTEGPLPAPWYPLPPYKEIHKLYPHHVSHWIGMDLHDTPLVSRSRKLLDGNTVTIEPGLYIPDSPEYPKEYRGIAVRIEDDVLVGKTCSTVLTEEAPKEIKDIED
ncbi:hypothetical protein HK102_011941, partial [Quaeritorhiza haematococci]